jgi:putative tryptophan/tyrosine transport system substrate-binding protein
MEDRMKRREFLITLVLSATMPCAHAQQPGKLYHIAIVHPTAPVAELTETGTARFIALFKELRRLGHVEGQNIAVERYSGAGRTEHSELASEVVRKKPDLILAITSRMVQNFKAATATIPIVGLMADPVPLGIVDSLARPGGNITGVCTDAGPEVLGKRLELLREVVPGISRVGLLTSRWVWEGPLGMAALRPAAERMGVSIIGPPLEEGTVQEAEYQCVFDAMIQGRADAVIVGDGAANLTYRRLIVELAAKSRLPTIYAYREQVEVGGLMAYAPDLLDVYRRAAGYVDQILKGTKAGDIPIFLAVKFDLVVNMKAAKAIGLTVPPALLLRANEVIE